MQRHPGSPYGPAGPLNPRATRFVIQLANAGFYLSTSAAPGAGVGDGQLTTQSR
jgi:hypothetical protein